MFAQTPFHLLLPPTAWVFVQVDTDVDEKENFNSFFCCGQDK